MTHRWIGGLVLATALALNACAPPGEGQADPTPLPTEAVPAEPTPSEAPERDNPDDYGY
ncbi:MAG: hypothetical protein ACRDGV_07295 [Candidatus Limnocylindria bacterium]